MALAKALPPETSFELHHCGALGNGFFFCTMDAQKICWKQSRPMPARALVVIPAL